jgi:hypothetical protein
VDIDDLQQQILSYSDFDYPVDVAKARKYVQTCRRILSLGVVEWYVGSNRIRFDPEFLKSEIIRAEQFIAANSSTSASPEVVHLTLEGFRE